MKLLEQKRILVFILICAVGLGWAVLARMRTPAGSDKGRGEPRSAPVEAAQIQRGPIELWRTFSGTLEATTQFVVAPKVSGRVKLLHVNLADTIEKGQVVAELDDDEYVQAVVQTEAELLVAEANLAEARSALEITTRKLNRIKMLRKSGVVSESQFDETTADHLAKQATLEVAKAHVTRAMASLETDKIRLGYTKVCADWTNGDALRVVSRRYVDEGETVTANAPLLSIVKLDPITGVIFVTEKDYARLKVGQSASLKTDAYPGELFQGRIERIAPVFQQASRQARVELTIENPHLKLKPGMFTRVTVVLDRVTEAFIVPEEALTVREEQTGVFVVDADGQSVSWRKVKVGIREDGRVQVEGEGLIGRVVTLGQQLLGDGSKITIPVKTSETDSTRKAAGTK
jgi:RND family efflux transporter MFP subunit